MRSSITLTLDAVGGTPTTLDLPSDLLWSDEFAWSAVSQSLERSITGAYLVDAHTRTAGRPITLQGKENVAWLQRADAKALKAWTDLPLQIFTLTHNGTPYSVMFDHGTDETSQAMEVTPVVEFSDPGEGDYYCSLTLRFFTV